VSVTWRATSARPYQLGEISSGLVGYYRFQRGLVAETMVADESAVVTGGTAVLEPGQGLADIARHFIDTLF